MGLGIFQYFFLRHTAIKKKTRRRYYTVAVLKECFAGSAITEQVALVVVVSRTASGSASATSTAAASSATAATAAAGESGEPSPSLVQVRPGNKVVTRIGSAPAADIPREVSAGAGSGAAGLRRGGALLLGGLLLGGLLGFGGIYF
jgi:hypothetical protein